MVNGYMCFECRCTLNSECTEAWVMAWLTWNIMKMTEIVDVLEVLSSSKALPSLKKKMLHIHLYYVYLYIIQNKLWRICRVEPWHFLMSRSFIFVFIFMFRKWVKKTALSYYKEVGNGKSAFLLGMLLYWKQILNLKWKRFKRVFPA